MMVTWLGCLFSCPSLGSCSSTTSPSTHSAQGTGYGRLLLAFAEDEALRAGFARIRLYTQVIMTRNISLYSRFGYIETHRGDKGLSRIYMQKQLA
jgi:ribosomal protein S18 acetylase RimI-like enzyme